MMFRKGQVSCRWQYDVSQKDLSDINVSLQHRRSHKQHSYICSNNQQYIVWVKIIHFLLWQKSLDIKIMFHEDITYRKYIKT